MALYDARTFRSKYIFLVNIESIGTSISSSPNDVKLFTYFDKLDIQKLNSNELITAVFLKSHKIKYFKSVFEFHF